MKRQLLGNTYVTAGGSENVASILALLNEEGIPTVGNPDVYLRIYKQFGIDDARELRERAALRPVGATQGSRRVFIIVAPDINREAQNALLKTLEEPQANALFILVLRSPETLLPTLLSRAQTLSLGENRAHEGVVDAKQFLAALPQERLELLKPLLEKGDDEKRDLGAILSFLASLERRFEKNPDGLRALYRARKYLTDRGALVKPLLEQVALLVPRT